MRRLPFGAVLFRALLCLAAASARPAGAQGAGSQGAGSPSALPAVAPKVSCASLRGFDPGLPGAPTQITDARETRVDPTQGSQQAGQPVGFQGGPPNAGSPNAGPPNAGPPNATQGGAAGASGTAGAAAGGTMMCVVWGYVSPQVRFEVRLPLAGWTQRYLQTGCGGLCGNLSIQAPQRPCPALARGEFATASTDMGHQGQGGTWGASDPQLRVDFAYRGVHVTALVAKALVRQFYGRAPRFSYFSGCSDGGREALMEAQRYPGDFDGIAAGAQAYNFLVQNSFYHGWNARTVAPDGKTAVLLARDLPVLHAAALAACDGLDGLRDGLIMDPTACRFDPAAVECRTVGQTDCLTHAAVVAAAELYRGAHDARGRKLVIGSVQPGSELAWAGVFVPQTADGMIASRMFASDMLRSLAYARPLPPGWDLAQFRFTTESLGELMPMHGLYDATDPDLSAFARRGGKLLMWHGWSDPHISPLNSVAYAQAVADRMGAAAAREVLRLFLVPGLYHCGGGDGLTSVDVLTPLVAWVEGGQAPNAIVASRSAADAAAGRGRAVAAWPATSVLVPNGDPERPASWRAGPPLAAPAKLYAGWAGARLFAPGYRQACGFDGFTFACRPAGAAP